MSKPVSGTGTGFAAASVKAEAEYVVVSNPEELKSASTPWNGLLNDPVKMNCKGVAAAKPGASEACLANPRALIVADEFPPEPFRKVKADPGGVQVCPGAGTPPQPSPTPGKTVCM